MLPPHTKMAKMSPPHTKNDQHFDPIIPKMANKSPPGMKYPLPMEKYITCAGRKIHLSEEDKFALRGSEFTSPKG
jgi:hypothetical protein